jgi:hypothetical protein
MTELGRLEKVELRSIWGSEDQDFTPWLAQEENLTVLADTIGVDLELEAQEKNVGPFRADILCRDTGTGDWVLIENQLERTDHTHMGQLMTYAAGLQAVTIVWVSSRFTDEHRAALDWLNDITDESFRFFGLEVELWRIDDSPAAPKFNVISKPNDWSRSIGQAAKQISQAELTDTKVQQLAYWTKLRDFLAAQGASVRPQKPRPQHWLVFSIGRSGFGLSTTVNTSKNRIGVELYLNNEQAKPYFHLLRDEKTEIEAEIGAVLDWQELPNRQASRVALFKDDVDTTNEADWPSQHAWIADHLQKFDKAFRQRVKNLDASDWVSDEQEAEPE